MNGPKYQSSEEMNRAAACLDEERKTHIKQLKIGLLLNCWRMEELHPANQSNSCVEGVRVWASRGTENWWFSRVSHFISKDLFLFLRGERAPVFEQTEVTPEMIEIYHTVANQPVGMSYFQLNNTYGCVWPSIKAFSVEDARPIWDLDPALARAFKYSYETYDITCECDFNELSSMRARSVREQQLAPCCVTSAKKKTHQVCNHLWSCLS